MGIGKRIKEARDAKHWLLIRYYNKKLRVSIVFCQNSKRTCRANRCDPFCYY